MISHESRLRRERGLENTLAKTRRLRRHDNNGSDIAAAGAPSASASDRDGWETQRETRDRVDLPTTVRYGESARWCGA